MASQFANVLTEIPPPDMEKPVFMQRNYAEQLEEATAQMAQDPFFMSTSSEDLCLYFRDLSPANIILAQTDDGNWKVSITCRDAWSMTEPSPRHRYHGYGEGCWISHTSDEVMRPSRAPHAQFPQ